MRRRDGTWVWVEGTGGPFVESGRPEFQVTLRDVTDRRQAFEAAQDALLRERQVYESIAEAYFQVDGDFRLVHMNRAAAALAGPQRPEELYGRVLWDLVPDIRGTRQEAELRRAVAEKVPVQLEEYDAKRRQWFAARAFPTKDGLSVYFQDITDRKRAEETERLAYQRSLEIASLKEINQYKTSFVNTAAHELGNPLTPIRIQASLLRNSDHSVTPRDRPPGESAGG